MDVLSLARQGINTLKANAGNSLTVFQIKKKTGSSYVNGKNTVTFAAPKDLTGMYSKFNHRDIDGLNVKVTDTLVMLFIDDNNDSPNIGDEIIHSTKVFQVVKPMPTLIGDTIVICEVQLRT